MKNILLLSSLVAVLAASAPLANANPSASNSSEAQVAQTLAVTGQIPVANAGDYIHAGSFRIWVSSHLGRPSHVLPGGTWLYDNWHVENSAVGGTLAVSFENGKVSGMRLLSPASVTALLHAAKAASEMVASR
jgi:hypothetical protein